tara:strand:+ start:342 stop:1085 length:744 start_codon:yes stop_codon:yes gene_type:complete
MKKLSIFIFTLAILFMACNENESIIENSEKAIILNIDYGKIHNESLEAYYNEYGFNAITNIKGLTEKLYDITKINNSELFINDNKEQSINFVINQIFEASTLTKYNYSRKTVNLFLEGSKSGLISSKLADFFIGIIERNESKDIILNQLDEFSSKNKLTIREQIYIDIFKSIYISSDQFWDEKEQLGLISFNKAIGSCVPSHQVRIADAAVGVAAFFLGGPVTSLIASQLASALVEHQQAENNGQCI